MPLTNIEIRAEIRARRLVFDPAIPDEHEQSELSRFDSSSVDLLLHDELIVLPRVGMTGVLVEPHPREGRFNVMEFLGKHGDVSRLEDGHDYRLEPGRLVIGRTLEYMTLPDHLAGRIEGRSTLARLGLAVHVTAPTVIAGFEGRLYLEIYNVGPFPIMLRSNMRIAQLVLEHTGLPPTQKYGGQYAGQR